MRAPDVLIVGAGSAGAVVAARLSEDRDRSVVLAEAGPDHGSDATPELISGLSVFGALSAPQRVWANIVATATSRSEPVLYPRGRGVGGTSAVNAMLALRGVPEDYDHWARDLGCAGWGWRDLLPVFDRVEDDGAIASDQPSRPIPLTRFRWDEWGPLDRAFVRAALSLGYDWCPDDRVLGVTGIGPAAFTIRDGKRVSTNDAYLEPARSRPNLTILGNTTVDRLAIDGRRVVGALTTGGDFLQSKDLILSAGTIHSPAILLRSGIGPEIGRPVGHNLIDHPAALITLSLRDEARIDWSRDRVTSAILRYSSGFAGAGDSDMQIFPLGAALGDSSQGFLGAAAMKVFSRGSVRLGPDPLGPPLIELRLLADERDRIRLRDGLKRLMRLVELPALQDVCTDAVAGWQTLESLSDDESIDVWLDANVSPCAHAVGTCRMGSRDDPAAVVDPECQVIGFDGVRVIDASVMPDIPRANTHLTTVALAERAVEAML